MVDEDDNGDFNAELLVHIMIVAFVVWVFVL